MSDYTVSLSFTASVACCLCHEDIDVEIAHDLSGIDIDSVKEEMSDIIDEQKERFGWKYGACPDCVEANPSYVKWESEMDRV
tara:strand:+ start:4193 stop:4438 length:246 start_codon:yes stop_codon:yes gene_type:complete